MEDYIKTKNIIANVCQQSGLSSTELSGVLSECLAELRLGMLSELVIENIKLGEKLKEAKQSGIKHE